MAIGTMSQILLAALAVLSPMSADAAFGFAFGTTGGGNVAAVRPTTIDQLKSLIRDNTPRVIEIDRTFDFRNTMGRTSEWGCFTNNCGANAEVGINALGFCNGRTSTWITYDNAGTTAQLVVGSHKTIRGVGTRGTIIGSGFRLPSSRNVIIQNIAIIDINPGVVWGGDGIRIEGAENIWIDHNYFARIGRQMLSTGATPSVRVTISDNIFDGRTTRSTYCNGNAYWGLLFTGNGDSVTFSGNLLQNLAGRGPQFGHGTFNVVNNYFRDHTHLGGIGCTSSGSRLLIEGNYFQRVVQPIQGVTARIYAPFWNSWRCDAVLGRWCVANDQVGSGTAHRPEDLGGLEPFGHLRNFVLRPFPASQVISFVTNHAGTGKI